MLTRRLEIATIILAIQVSLLYVWGLAAGVKFVDADYRNNFINRFDQSALGSLPGGAATQLWFIAVIEAIAFALVLISLLRREFWNFDFRWLRVSLASSVMIFSILGFGLRWIKDFQGSANIYFYMGATVVFYFFILKIEQNKISYLSSKSD